MVIVWSVPISSDGLAIEFGFDENVVVRSCVVYSSVFIYLLRDALTFIQHTLIFVQKFQYRYMNYFQFVKLF